MRAVAGAARKGDDPYIAGLRAALGTVPRLLDEDQWSYRLVGEVFGVGPDSPLFRDIWRRVGDRFAEDVQTVGPGAGRGNVPLHGAIPFQVAFDFTGVPDPYRTELKAYVWWTLAQRENHSPHWRYQALRLIAFAADLAATATALPRLIDYGAALEEGNPRGAGRLRRMFEGWMATKGYRPWSSREKVWAANTEAGTVVRERHVTPLEAAVADGLARTLVVLRERMKPLDQRDVILLGDVFDREDVPRRSRSEPYISFYAFRLPWLRDIARRYVVYRLHHRDVAAGSLSSFLNTLVHAERCLLELHADPGIEHLDQKFLDEDFLNWGNHTRRLAGRNWYQRAFNMLDWAYVHLERDWRPLRFNKRNFRRLANDYTGGKNYDRNMAGKMVPEVVMEQILSKRDLLPPVFKRILIIERYTGMRATELHSISIDCLQPDPNDDDFMVLTYWQNKTQTGNCKPLHKEDAAHALVIEVIQQQQAEARQRFGPDVPCLFPVKQGDTVRPMHMDTSRKFMSVWCVQNDIRDEQGRPYKFRWHAFRHYHATQMALGGADVHLIQMELGHTSTVMAVHYVNERLKLRKKAVLEKGGGRFIDIRGVVDERAAELALRKESLAVDVPGGMCGMPGQLGDWCENNRACFNCQHFRADMEQLAFFEKERATLARTISRLQAEVEAHQRDGKNRMAEIGLRRLGHSRKALEHVGTIVATIKDKGAFHGSEPKQRRAGGLGGEA